MPSLSLSPEALGGSEADSLPEAGYFFGRAALRQPSTSLRITDHSRPFCSDRLHHRAARRPRGILPLGHPAAQIDARHLDAQGVPLWEGEWNGGMDLGAGAGEDGSEDEG
ncbi:hypothetical protein BV20DRAFT_1122696 [Pilatotrama ljubarskyi]|nr:hypothetical protein BV20DRAFT_1122696 [Pilatotrama ljubarskyi]